MASTGEVNLILNAGGTAISALKALRSELTNFQTTFRAGFNLNLGAQAASFILALPGHVKNLASQSLQLASSLKDQSDALGISTKALQVYRIALDGAGGRATQLDSAIASSNRALVDARNNSSVAAEAFRTLGLDAGKLSRLPIEQRFDAIARAVRASRDPLAAFSAAGQVLGAKGLPTLLSALQNVSREGFDKFAASASAAGQIVADDTIVRLEAAEKQIKRVRDRLVIYTGDVIAFWHRALGGGDDKPAVVPQPPAPEPVPAASRELQIKAKLRAIELDRQRIEGDTIDSEVEKNERIVPLIDRQVKLLIELQKIRTDGVNLTDDESRLTEEQLSKLKERREIEADIIALRQEGDRLSGIVPGHASRARRDAAGVENPVSPVSNPNFVSGRDAVGTGINEFISQAGSTGEQVAQTLTETLGTAVQGISDGIYGWITGANTFADTMRGLGLSVLRQTLDTIVQIGIQQVVNGNAAKAIAIGWKALTSALRTADTAETVAAEATKTPILATNAALSSASSFGLSAVIGIAALALAIGAFIAGFEGGGYTGDGNKSAPAGVVHRGEYVLTADEVNRLGIGRIEAFKNLRGYETGGYVGIPVTRGAGADGSSQGRNIILVDSERSANRIARNSQAESDVIRIMTENRERIFF